MISAHESFPNNSYRNALIPSEGPQRVANDSSQITSANMEGHHPKIRVHQFVATAPVIFEKVSHRLTNESSQRSIDVPGEEIARNVSEKLLMSKRINHVRKSYRNSWVDPPESYPLVPFVRKPHELICKIDTIETHSSFLKVLGRPTSEPS